MEVRILSPNRLCRQTGRQAKLSGSMSGLYDVDPLFYNPLLNPGQPFSVHPGRIINSVALPRWLVLDVRVSHRAVSLALFIILSICLF